MGLNELGRLIVRTAEGDNDAFRKLYLKTRRGVYAFLYTYFSNSADTEDAMQTVYLKVKTNCTQFKAGTNGRAWLLQIAKNHALDQLRKGGRTVALDEAYGVSAPERAESDGTVFSVMNKVLSEEEQRIIVMHVLWGYKHKEISSAFDIPLGTVTSKYKRAIAKLKSALKEEQ